MSGTAQEVQGLGLSGKILLIAVSVLTLWAGRASIVVHDVIGAVSIVVGYATTSAVVVCDVPQHLSTCVASVSASGCGLPAIRRFQVL